MRCKIIARDKKVHTIREQIANHIRVDILSGQLPEGEQLREQSLAKRFGVSRGPIRDVLLQLTQEGLLVSKPNCGVKVGAPLDELIQPLIVDLRQRIEIFALKKNFKALNNKTIKSLDIMVESLRIACKAGDLAAIVTHDMAFHRYIVEMAGDKDIVAVWLPIIQRMMLHYTRHEDMMENYREHAAIVKAIRTKDFEQAVDALKQNIQ